MSQLRVPRVHIVIPSSHTSRHKFEPRYVLPLFAAEHQASLADPSNPVHEEAHPEGIKDQSFYWQEIDSVENEYENTRARFPRVFDYVYPNPSSFYAAVEREMSRGVDIEAAVDRATQDAPSIELTPWLKGLKMRGLTEERKLALALQGLDAPSAIQATEVLKLAEVVGGAAAKALKAAVEGLVDEDAEPVEDVKRVPAPVK